MAGTENSVLLVRRNEYVSELITSMKERFLSGIQHIYDQVLALNQTASLVLREFQLQCKDIGMWTDERIDNEVTRFKNPIHLAKLLRAIDTLNQRIYTHPNLHTNSGSVGTDPYIDFKKFVYECYLQLGRELWKVPQLLYHGFPRPERHANSNTLGKMVVVVMKTILRKRIPFDDENLLDLVPAPAAVVQAPTPVASVPVASVPVVIAPVAPVLEVVQEPVVQEPVVHAPVVQEPVVHAPVVQEPVVQEPVVQEPVVHATQDPNVFNRLYTYQNSKHRRQRRSTSWKVLRSPSLSRSHSSHSTLSSENVSVKHSGASSSASSESGEKSPQSFFSNDLDVDLQDPPTFSISPYYQPSPELKRYLLRKKKTKKIMRSK